MKTKTFVEIGANDGSEQSKTASLIKAGWKAHLIEPCSFYFDKLVDRYLKNNRVSCDNVAIASEPGERKMYYIHPEDIEQQGLPDWAGLLGSFDKKHIEKHVWHAGVRIVEETVQCVRLETSLKENGIEAIDLLVADVEGAELDVMKSFDLAAVKPRFIELEVKHLDRKTRRELEKMLRDAGYCVAPLTDPFGNDSVFAHLGQFKTPEQVSGRKAVVTFADKRFLPGLEVMVHSLLKHTEIDQEAWELVVLSNELTDDDMARVKTLWPSVTVRPFDTKKYDGINKTLKARMEGANGSYYKFEVFALDDFERVVYLDSDIVVLQDLTDLFECDAPLGAVKELLIDQYNTGVMTIGSRFLGTHVVDALIEATEILGPKEHADQDTISTYLWEHITELPVTFNFLKTYYNYPFLQQFPFPSHIKVLHFIIHKPWMWDGMVNQIELGTEGLNAIWHREYGELQSGVSKAQ